MPNLYDVFFIAARQGTFPDYRAMLLYTMATVQQLEELCDDLDLPMAGLTVKQVCTNVSHHFTSTEEFAGWISTHWDEYAAIKFLDAMKVEFDKYPGLDEWIQKAQHRFDGHEDIYGL